jgi:phosphoribosylamine--glycine ligase
MLAMSIPWWRWRMVGPSRRDARLEGSKIFAKEFMSRYRIPTPTLYGTFESAGEAIRALDAVDWPVVVKADGLCAGKGVLVAETREEAAAFIRCLLEKHALGQGGSRILLETALKGERPQTSFRWRPRPEHRRHGRVHG